MNTTNDEKVCSFYASDYHFEMISLPYIRESLKENRKVIIFTENNLEKTINKVLDGMNLDENIKNEILKIDWGDNDYKKLEDLEKATLVNEKILIFIKGKENYIKNMENQISKISNDRESEIIDCYDVIELGNNTDRIAKNYNKILNTVGKILLK